MIGGRKSAKAKAAKNAKGKRRSGDPRKAGLTPAPAPEPAAVEAAPQSMEELAEMLRDAQAAGGQGGAGGFGEENEGIPGIRGGPSALPPAFGGGGRGGNVIPAAFGKRDKKKK
jgi:hypothetical protein